MKRSKTPFDYPMDVWMFEGWWSNDIKKESEKTYQKYMKTSIEGRRDKAYRILNSLVEKGYVEKMYNEPKSIRYRLKNQYDNLV